jgi:hypothetical protein
MRPAITGFEHRHGGLIGIKYELHQRFFPERVHQRLQPRAIGADPMPQNRFDKRDVGSLEDAWYQDSGKFSAYLTIST